MRTLDEMNSLTDYSILHSMLLLLHELPHFTINKTKWQYFIDTRLDAPAPTFVCLYTHIVPVTLCTVWTQQRQRMFALFQLEVRLSSDSSLTFNSILVIWCDFIAYVWVLWFLFFSDMYTSRDFPFILLHVPSQP